MRIVKTKLELAKSRKHRWGWNDLLTSTLTVDRGRKGNPNNIRYIRKILYSEKKTIHGFYSKLASFAIE